MKARYFASFVIIFLVLAVVWKLHRQQPTVEPEMISVQQKTNEAQIALPAPANNSHVIKAATNLLLATDNQRKMEDWRKQIIDERNVPIEFFGKVVDQDSNPIAGVTIQAAVVYVDVVVQVKRTTAADGRFEISGLKGTGFDLNVLEKAGYEPEPFSRGHGVAGGSLDNPVVFKMWSTNIHEQLISGSKPFDIIPDGRPYFINFADDSISESDNGDLKVWIQYTNQVVRGQLDDWSAGIEVINGGLQETKDYSMFSAPSDGYVPNFIWKNQIKGGQRGSIGQRRFYLALKNGQEYGRMTIEMIAPFNNQTPGLIRLSYAINPSGSRILR